MCGADCLRFISTPDVIVEELPWGPHDWFVKPGLTASEHLMLVRVTMPPGEAHQFHRHPHFEEAIYYLSGRAEQWVGTEKRVMSAGEVAHVPKNEVHATYNVFDEDCVFLAILGSAEFMEPMTVDVFRDAPWNEFHTPR
ncbi:MAG: quercetin dioxygenase-like cupin family protein [Planctomycetota bacterium]|jgi:quercetin dioxygenase-like cupin family protein